MNGQRPRVLVVEDEQMVAEVVERYLRRDGYEVMVAGSGTDALEAFAEFCPALVVLDVMLPGIDGLEVCRRVRSTETHRSSCSQPGARRPTSSRGSSWERTTT